LAAGFAYLTLAGFLTALGDSTSFLGDTLGGTVADLLGLVDTYCTF
jgi:hypothetical protein